jgi:UMF1 family MFS transporter
MFTLLCEKDIFVRDTHVLLFLSLSSLNKTGPGLNRENCEDLEVVRVSGGFRPSSFAFVIISFSCISQLLVFALYGARGDTGYRKKGLRMTTVLGGASLLVFAAFSERHAKYKHVVAAILAVFSNTMYGLSVIFYNSYLPILAKESEAILSEGKEEDHDYENELSTKGYAAGYLSGVFGLLLSLVVLFLSGGSDEDASDNKASSAFRWCIVLAGVWWLGFGVYFCEKLRDDGDDEVDTEQENQTSSSELAKMKDSLGRFAKTISEAKSKFPVTFSFLILYFAYTDGFSTIAGLGVLYAQRDMCTGTTGLFLIALLAPLSAAVGNFVFLFIKRKLNASNQAMVVSALFSISILPIWGLLGYVSSTIGFRNSWEAYFLAIWFGLNLGAIQSFSRTLFCELIPPHRESEFFSFFELTDKGSSWVGPLVISIIANSSGNLRRSFWYILCMTIIPAFFVLRLDVAKGKKMVNEKRDVDERL